MGQILLTMPPLTQTLGPWFKESKGKYAKILATQKDYMHALIDEMPKFALYSQSWHYQNTNWLPFYWRNFTQKTYYTYILPDLSDEKKLWSGLQGNIRSDIRKAKERYNLRVRDHLSLDEFLHLNRLTFERQGKKPPYSDELIKNIDKACMNHKCRKICIAQDDKGRLHAGVYIIWDENSAYYLLGGGDPELRNSGATSLCLWTAICHAADVTKKFNFEGSMIEPIERFFRAFGALQKPYFFISKTSSRLIRIRSLLREIIN